MLTVSGERYNSPAETTNAKLLEMMMKLTWHRQTRPLTHSILAKLCATSAAIVGVLAFAASDASADWSSWRKRLDQLALADVADDNCDYRLRLNTIAAPGKFMINTYAITSVTSEERGIFMEATVSHAQFQHLLKDPSIWVIGAVPVFSSPDTPTNTSIRFSVSSSGAPATARPVLLRGAGSATVKSSAVNLERQCSANIR
jgi:hypothetical protein